MDETILEQLNSTTLEQIEKKIIQEYEKDKNGKYAHIKKRTDKNGVEYSVTEYVCPNNEVGFDILFYKTIEDKDYMKIIGYGFEANSRSKDWALTETNG